MKQSKLERRKRALDRKVDSIKYWENRLLEPYLNPPFQDDEDRNDAEKIKDFYVKKIDLLRKEIGILKGDVQ
jgi:hypothetical protein